MAYYNKNRALNILDPGVLRDRAISYCIEHVFFFDTFTDDEREEQIRMVIKLFLEDEELKRQLFAGQIN